MALDWGPEAKFSPGPSDGPDSVTGFRTTALCSGSPLIGPLQRWWLLGLVAAGQLGLDVLSGAYSFAVGQGQGSIWLPRSSAGICWVVLGCLYTATNIMGIAAHTAREIGFSD